MHLRQSPGALAGACLSQCMLVGKSCIKHLHVQSCVRRHCQSLYRWVVVCVMCADSQLDGNFGYSNGNDDAASMRARPGARFTVN